MADDNIKFRLDLDADEFVKAIKEAQGNLSLLGDADNLKGLIGAFDSLVPALGIIGVALVALKATMDAVFEGERIQSVNTQFEILTRNAGLSGEALKAGLEKSANGFINTTNLLQVANKAIIAMGGSAGKLPEIMELARKASVVTGETVQTTFENLTNAISQGNVRALKHAGIVVDLDKAYKAYADSVGIAVSALSDEEKRAALAQAAIEKGNKALAGVDESVLGATNAWQQLKVALIDVKETFVTIFEKTIGPSVQKGIGYFADYAKWLKQSWQNILGVDDAARRATQSVGQLNANASKGTQGIGGVPEADLAKRKESEAKFEKEITQIRLQGVTEREKVAITEIEYDDNLAKQRLLIAQEFQAKIKSIEQSNELSRDQRRALILALEQEQSIKLLEIEAQAIDKKAQLQKQDLETRTQIAMSEEETDALFIEQRLLLEEQFQEKIQLTRDNQVLSEAEKNARIILLEEQLKGQLITLNADEQNVVLKSYENQVRAADTAYKKLISGAQLAGAKARKEFLDLSTVGSNLTQKLGTNVANAFEQIGEGAISVGDGMKKAFIGALADIAQAQGTEAMIAAFATFPPNLGMFAAGAALSGLAGILKAAAGGGGSSIPTTASVGGGASDTTSSVGAYTPQSPLSQTPTPNEYQSPRKIVTIQVQGNYFETEQTKQRLVELVRDAADATDFKILSVGGGV